MLFTTLAFLIFSVTLFFVYYLVPKKFQWIVLLIGSGVFYFWAGWQYFLFLIGTILLSYVIGLWLGLLNDKQNEKLKECSPDLIDSISSKYKKYKQYKE